MFQIASFRIICTGSTEILFSKLRSAGLKYHLPKRYSLFLTMLGGSLISIAFFHSFQSDIWFGRCHYMNLKMAAIANIIDLV